MIKKDTFVKVICIFIVTFSLFLPSVFAGNSTDDNNEIAEITIKAVVSQLKFDLTEFTVKPGQTVRLTFENPDFMPHNLLIVSPGTADEINRQAMSAGFAMDFVPDSEHVLFASKLLNSQESEIMEFIAPSAADEYPYICTFPGHGDLMRGVMVVAE